MKKDKYLSVIQKEFTPFAKPEEILLNSNCLVYDFELSSLFASAKNMYDILKKARERFLRKDSLNISKSVFHYMQLMNDLDKYPYTLYCFLHRNVKICITQYKKLYHVFCIGANFNKVFGKYRSSCGANLFGDFNSLSDCIELYDDIVRWYCATKAYEESQNEL